MDQPVSVGSDHDFDLPPPHPRELRPVPGRAGGTRTMKGGDRLDLGGFVPPIVHPVKVAILRALAEGEEPLGAVELARAVDHPATTSQIAYHALTLAQQGAVESIVEGGDRPIKRYRLARQEPV